MLKLPENEYLVENHGTDGDSINALLCGCGLNLRKLMKAFLSWSKKHLIQLQCVNKKFYSHTEISFSSG